MTCSFDINRFIEIRKYIVNELKSQEIQFHNKIQAAAENNKPKWNIRWRTEVTEFIGEDGVSILDFKEQFGTFGLEKLKELIQDETVYLEDSGKLHIKSQSYYH